MKVKIRATQTVVYETDVEIKPAHYQEWLMGEDYLLEQYIDNYTDVVDAYDFDVVDVEEIDV